MTSGIYAIVNIPTGEQYIGASGNIQDRWVSHSCNRHLPKKKVKYHRFTIELSPDLVDQIDAIAEKRDLTRTMLFEQEMARFVAREEAKRK